MITARRSIDTVLQREMKFASTFGWKIPWCSRCFISEIIVFILIIGLSVHCCIHWKSHEMKASLKHPKRSLNAMRLGTIGSVMPSIFFVHLITVIRQGIKEKLQDTESLSWAFPRGEDDNMCPAVTHSCWPLKWYPRWVPAASGWLRHNSWGGPINWVMTALRTLVNTIVSLDFLGLPCYFFFFYWSYIIETLRRRYFLLLAKSVSFSVKLHRARAKLNDCIWRNSSFWMRTSDLKAAIIALGCVFFFTPPPEKSVLCLTGGQVEYVFVVCRDTSFIVHTLGTQPVFASPSALKKKKKNTAETSWLIYLSLWYTAYHMTGQMAVTYSSVRARFIICDSEWSHR